MLDVVALGELLIDFTYQNADEFVYPTMAAHPRAPAPGYPDVVRQVETVCAYVIPGGEAP